MFMLSSFDLTCFLFTAKANCCRCLIETKSQSLKFVSCPFATVHRRSQAFVLEGEFEAKDENGEGFFGRDSEHPPHQLGGRERYKLSSGVQVLIPSGLTAVYF